MVSDTRKYLGNSIFIDEKYCGVSVIVLPTNPNDLNYFSDLYAAHAELFLQFIFALVLYTNAFFSLLYVREKIWPALVLEGRHRDHSIKTGGSFLRIILYRIIQRTIYCIKISSAFLNRTYEIL